MEISDTIKPTLLKYISDGEELLSYANKSLPPKFIKLNITEILTELKNNKFIFEKRYQYKEPKSPCIFAVLSNKSPRDAEGWPWENGGSDSNTEQKNFQTEYFRYKDSESNLRRKSWRLKDPKYDVELVQIYRDSKPKRKRKKEPPESPPIKKTKVSDGTSAPDTSPHAPNGSERIESDTPQTVVDPLEQAFPNDIKMEPTFGPPREKTTIRITSKTTVFDESLKVTFNAQEVNSIMKNNEILFYSPESPPGIYKVEIDKIFSGEFTVGVECVPPQTPVQIDSTADWVNEIISIPDTALPPLSLDLEIPKDLSSCLDDRISVARKLLIPNPGSYGFMEVQNSTTKADIPNEISKILQENSIAITSKGLVTELRRKFPNENITIDNVYYNLKNFLKWKKVIEVHSKGKRMWRWRKDPSQEPLDESQKPL